MQIHDILVHGEYSGFLLYGWDQLRESIKLAFNTPDVHIESLMSDIRRSLDRLPSWTQSFYDDHDQDYPTNKRPIFNLGVSIVSRADQKFLLTINGPNSSAEKELARLLPQIPQLLQTAHVIVQTPPNLFHRFEFDFTPIMTALRLMVPGSKFTGSRYVQELAAATADPHDGTPYVTVHTDQHFSVIVSPYKVEPRFTFSAESSKDTWVFNGSMLQGDTLRHYQRHDMPSISIRLVPNELTTPFGPIPRRFYSRTEDVQALGIARSIKASILANV